jgi:ubiquinone/menaquinone biosynthesis C-methylase UbiE
MTSTLGTTGPGACRDDSVVAARLVLVAERLCDGADLHAGWRVLDVGTGSGDGALAAARLGCAATGIEPAPALLDRARARAAAEGLDVELLQGDLSSLPFQDASFDAVLSLFSAAVSPDAAAELLRVCKPGGTIALAAWTSDGFLGELLRALGDHARPEDDPLALIGDGVASLELTKQTFTFRFESPECLVDSFRRWHAPTAAAFAALDGEDLGALETELAALARRFDRLGAEAIAIPATYVEAIALRR